MKVSLLLPIFFLFTFSISAQNGVYDCKRQEYRTINQEDNTEHYNQCTITIQIYGVGGNDFLLAKIQSENPKENITYKWHINSELRMSPAAKGKQIFRSYLAVLDGIEGESKYYQISIIKGAKSGKITVAAIDNEGSTYWFYDLGKIE